MSNDVEIPAVEAVRDYYDFNTRRWFRRPRVVDTIHRAVWGEGVRSETEAFHYVDALVLREVEEVSRDLRTPLRVLDLGCGIGGSLIFLASSSDISGSGVTVSPVQARYAAERIVRAGLANRVSVMEADFLHLPETLKPAHLAYSIEAFIHGPDPAAYFAAVANALVPGGMLIVCDDFLSGTAPAEQSSFNGHTLRAFRDGWLAHSLISVDKANEHAQQAGFEPVRNEIGRAHV